MKTWQDKKILQNFVNAVIIKEILTWGPFLMDSNKIIYENLITLNFDLIYIATVFGPLRKWLRSYLLLALDMNEQLVAD